MPELTASLLTTPSLLLEEVPLPPSLGAATARVGLDEVALLEGRASGAGPARCPPPAGPRLDALRAVHACYAAVAEPADWLGAVVRALRPIASTATWFAWRDGVLGPPAAARSQEALFPALLDAVGADCYRDLLRPQPAIQLLSHRLRALPPALERRVSDLLRAHGVPDAVLLLGGESGGRATAVGMVVAPGQQPGSRTIGLLRHVAGHLNTARALREELSPGQLTSGAARSVPRAAAARLLARGALRREDPEGAARLWRALFEGHYALLEHWVEGDRLRVLARRCQGVGDPAALRPLEWTVLALVASGLSRRHARERLGITPRTAGQCLSGAAARLRCVSERDLTLLAAPALAAGADAGQVPVSRSASSRISSSCGATSAGLATPR